MGEYSAIEWTGCTKISRACDNCYAESWAKRAGVPELWTGNRRRTTAANWRKPLVWDRRASQAGRRDRVFCASLADVFDNQVPSDWRRDLWALIAATPHLDWMLLTKRPQNIAKMLPANPDRAWPWPNVWLGTTAEDERTYRQRWSHVAAVPAAVRFLSYEPALGPIGDLDLGRVGAPDWAIVGGESGPGARPMHPDWARSVRDQCQAAGVPYLLKQWGESLPDSDFMNRPGKTFCMDRRGRIVDAPANVHDFPSPLSHADGWVWMRRVGKKRAGRLLDGREWNEFPDAKRAAA